MRIEVLRSKFNGTNTIGRMLVNGQFFAHTLEDAYRKLSSKEDKVYGETAIPYGTYLVTVTKSARFKRDLPLLHDVPYFTAIRIHGGNDEHDTEGCILIGANTNELRVWNCKAKVDELTAMIKASKKPVTITIKPEVDPGLFERI